MIRSFSLLGLEALLAYYRLNQDAVEISKDNKKFSITGTNGEKIIECDMIEGQFLEVNWFSKWTDLVEEEELAKSKKKFYGDGDYQNYLQQIKPILNLLLSRAYADEKDKDISDTLGSIKGLGIDSEVVGIAENF